MALGHQMGVPNGTPPLPRVATLAKPESGNSRTPFAGYAGERHLENCIASTNVLDSFMSKLLRVHGGCLGVRSR